MRKRRRRRRRRRPRWSSLRLRGLSSSRPSSMSAASSPSMRSICGPAFRLPHRTRIPRGRGCGGGGAAVLDRAGPLSDGGRHRGGEGGRGEGGGRPQPQGLRAGAQLVRQRQRQSKNPRSGVGRPAAGGGDGQRPRGGTAAGADRSRLHADHAPFDGRIGRSIYSVGQWVGPDSGVLATLVKLDPIYVVFNVSERSYLDYLTRVEQAAREGGASGRTSCPAEALQRLRISASRTLRLRRQPGRSEHRDHRRPRRVSQSGASCWFRGCSSPSCCRVGGGRSRRC